ncbi:hypothetical protein V4762_09595 [Thermodesulfobium sp. 4217-1]|uniref:hypothetical protein n=1 Tax=Thermodesulfobium sp. 4217-1 TaxID=3120013 RepID=UPI0032218F19
MSINLEDFFKEINREIQSNNFEEALNKSNYLLSLIDANEVEFDTEFLIKLLDTRSFILTIMGNNAQALEDINRAIEEKNGISSSSDDQLAKLLIHRGLNYFYLGDHISSLKDFNTAIEILSSSADKESTKLPQVFLNRSALLKKQGLRKESLEDINKAISLLTKINNSKSILILINALIEKGLLLMEEEKFFESAYNFDLAISKSRQLLTTEKLKILGTHMRLIYYLIITNLAAGKHQDPINKLLMEAKSIVNNYGANEETSYWLNKIGEIAAI